MKQVQAQTKQTAKVVEAQTSKIKTAFSKIGKIIGAALSVAALVRFGKSCIELGSALAEVQNVVDVTFGDMAEDINQFAREATTQFGLSETTAKKFTSTLGAMLKSMKFTTKEAAEMSKTMTGLAADMASFYNLEAEEAFQKIRAGISGETEPLKQLGINLSVANLQEYALAQGITKSYNAMTQQEQALLRYNYLLSVTADAQGDFARTSDGWANQIRILTERWNALKAAIGQGLIAVLTPVVRILNIVLEKILQVTNAFSAFIAKITGKSQTAAKATGGIGTSLGSASEKADDLATETTKAGSAAKKAKKEYSGLASFDEIHNLNKATDSSGSGSSGGAAGGLDEGIVDAAGAVDDGLNPALDGLINRLKELWELFKQGFMDGLGDVNLEPLKAAIQGIKDSLKEIWEDPRVQKAFQNWLDTMAYSLGVIAGSMASIGITIATNLLGGLNKYLDQNKERIKLWLVDVFNITGEIATIRANLWKALADIFSVFGGDTGQQVTANIIGIFTDAFMGISTLFLKFERDLEKMFYQPIIDNKDKIKQALQGILEVFESITGSIKEVVDNTMDKANQVYDEKIHPVLEDIQKGLSDTVGKFFDMWNSKVKPILDDLAKKFDDLMDNHIQPMIDSFIELVAAIAEEIGGFYNEVLKPMMDWVIDNVVPAIASFVDGALTVLMDIIGWIADRIADLNKFLNEHRAVLEVIITVVGAIAAAIAIVQGAIAAFMGIISAVSGIIAAVKTAILGLQIAFAVLTSPIGLVVAAIAAVIAIGVLLYRHWDEVKAFCISTWNKIKTAVSNAVEAVKQSISDTTDRIKSKWDEIWTNIYNFFSNIWNNIKSFVTTCINTVQTIINAVLNTIKTIFNTIWNAIYSLVQTIWNNMKSFINTTINAIQSIINTVLNAIKTIFSNVWNAIYTLVQTIWNNLKTFISNTINAISTTISTVLNSIKTTFSNIWNSIYTTVTTIVSNMKNSIINAINSLKSTWDSVWNGMKDAAINAFNGLWGGIKGVINNILGGIESMANGVVRGINKIISAANAVGDLVGIEVSYVSEVSLPRLAKGGIIDSPMFAEIGENGKEAVVPLEKNTGWMDNLAARLGDVLATNIQNLSGEDQIQPISTIVKLDSKTLVEQTDYYRQRRGYQMAKT